MALYGGLAVEEQFGEFNSPRTIAGVVKTPAQQKAAAIANLGITATAAELNILDGVTATAAELNILDGVTATAAEINSLDISARTQDITAAGAIDLAARHVRLTGPASSTYAVTLAVPAEAGIVKIIEMVATTATNAVTLALTNVVGGSAATTASFDAAGEILVLISAGSKWVVFKEVGVTLT